MSAEHHRKTATRKFVKQGGCDETTAAMAALALHPFDNDWPGSREFAKVIRKCSRAFAKSAQHATCEQLGELASDALFLYKMLAEEHGEMHYIEWFDAALGDGT
ncbi:hypothetical protein HQ535_02015 [bacterium]|nr:hypothetical protein [bacterium]